MFGSVRTTKGALACLLVVGAMSAGCSAVVLADIGAQQPAAPGHPAAGNIGARNGCPGISRLNHRSALACTALDAAAGQRVANPGGADTTDGQHVPGPRREPDREPEPGSVLDLRHGRRHRVLRSRPPLHRRRKLARPRQRPARGIRQRLRLRLCAAHQRRLRDLLSTARHRPSWAQGSVLLRIGIQARSVAQQLRPPAGTDIRHRYVRFDGRRRAPRDRQALTRPACLATRAAGLDSRSSQFSDTASVVVPGQRPRRTQGRS